MRDSRGIPFKPGCTVGFLGDVGEIVWDTVVQVIDMTGELVIKGLDFPVTSVGYFVFSPRPPEVLIREALVRLLAEPMNPKGPKNLDAFVRPINEALASTPLWLKRVYVPYERGPKGNLCFVNRINNNTSGDGNHGVGLEWPELVFRLRDERDIFYMGQDLTDPEFIVSVIMDWVERMLGVIK